MSLASFGRQVQAELLKARRRSLFQGGLIALLAFSMLPIAMAVAALGNKDLRPYAELQVAYPRCLWQALSLIQALLVLPAVVAIVAVGMVGGEYAAATWKMTLPRIVSRSSALGAKAVAALLLTTGMLWLTGLLAIAMGAIGARLLGVPFFAGSVTAGELGGAQAFFAAEFVLVIGTALLTSVLSRALVGGILLTILAPHLIKLANFLPGGWVLPFRHLDALEARWLTGTNLKAADVEAALGHAVGWQGSLASVLIFSAVFCAVAMWLFERRDLASDS